MEKEVLKNQKDGKISYTAYLQYKTVICKE